jgi:hypothetical protein
VPQRLIEPMPETRIALADGVGAVPARPPAFALPVREVSRLWATHPVLVTAGLLILFSLVRLGSYAVLADQVRGFAASMCQYDCFWYQDTARHGYDLVTRGDHAGDTANWAFFPLYPMLLGLFAALRLADPVLTTAGILLSTACFIGFGACGAVYLRQTSRTVQAGLSPLLAWLGFLTLWPGTLYFSMPYSEALYALLMTASLLALLRRRPVTASIGCALLDATRPTGLLMVPVIAVERLRMLWQAWGRGSLRRDPFGHAAGFILPLAIAPLGLVAFVAFLQWHMGDGLAFAHVQVAWHRHTLAPWIFLWEGLATNDWWRLVATPRQESLSAEALVGLLGLALALRQALVGRYAEAWLIGASLLMASANGLQSLPRFLLTNPIAILAVFRLLHDNLSPRLFWMLAGGLGLLQFFMVLGWFSHAPILS